MIRRTPMPMSCSPSVRGFFTMRSASQNSSSACGSRTLEISSSMLGAIYGQAISSSKTPSTTSSCSAVANGCSFLLTEKSSSRLFTSTAGIISICDMVYLCDAPHVPLFAGKRRGQPSFDRLFRVILGEKSRAERENIRIVVYARRFDDVERLSGSVFLFASSAVKDNGAHPLESVRHD